MTANTYGRQVVIPLTNKSGGGVIAGDVVVIDTTNNDAFTTSTAGAVTITVGVAQETIANNAVGRVLMSGYAALINVNASVTRGNYGKTYTVAKQATDAGASRVAGTFVQFFTGGTTPDGQVFPVDLAGAALTNPMTTKGDVILGDTGGTPTRLGAGTSGNILTSNGAAAFPSWQAAAAASLTTATQAATSDTSLSATVVADITGCTFSLATGTWWLSAEMYVDPGAGTTIGYAIMEITDNSNTILAISRAFTSALGSGNAQAVVLANVPIVLGGTTTVKMRGLTQEATTISKNGAGASSPTTYMTALKVA